MFQVAAQRVRLWLTYALVLAGLASSAVVATAETAAAPVLTVTAVRTASTTLTLPAVALDITGTLTSPDIDVSGKGRIVGIALRPATPANAMPALVAVQMQSCYERGCVGRFRVQFVSGSIVGNRPGRKVLPAGRYRLQAFTDGAPLTVTLRLHGLRQSTQVRPTRPADFTVDSPRWTLAGTGPVSPGVDLTPAHYTVRRPGIEEFVFGQVDWRAAIGGDLSACFYNADVPLILPECAGGSGIAADGVLVSPTPATQLLYADYSSSADTGPSSAGFALAHGSAATAVAANVAWLES